MIERIEMCVTGIQDLTPEIKEFRLSNVSDRPLPTAVAGAHITVETPSGAMRRYSLLHPDNNPESYTIAVKRETASRGGSQSMHTDLSAGDSINIEPPQNDFALVSADRYLLIAGGIGITPIYAMVEALSAANKPFQLIYCTRSPEHTAYGKDLQQLCGNAITLHHDQGEPALVYDFWDHFESPGKEHVYCCGPAPLMEEVKALSGHWPEENIHFEEFKTVEIIREDDKPFDIILEKSNRKLTVPADRTILETIRDADIKTTSSCESGTCGTCRTRLISGEVDHRDMVLLDEEKENQIMICISRANKGDLILDL
ncbi:MAG: PDR/VanB family oxidoreductase [Methyloligellaceae bacterium]